MVFGVSCFCMSYCISGSHPKAIFQKQARETSDNFHYSCNSCNVVASFDCISQSIRICVTSSVVSWSNWSHHYSICHVSRDDEKVFLQKDKNVETKNTCADHSLKNWHRFLLGFRNAACFSD